MEKEEMLTLEEITDLVRVASDLSYKNEIYSGMIYSTKINFEIICQRINVLPWVEKAKVKIIEVNKDGYPLDYPLAYHKGKKAFGIYRKFEEQYKKLQNRGETREAKEYSKQIINRNERTKEMRHLARKVRELTLGKVNNNCL